MDEQEKTAQDVLGSNTYTCAICKGEFEKGWSDEEAVAEKDSYWGDVPLDECGVICDDCWNKIRPDAP